MSVWRKELEVKILIAKYENDILQLFRTLQNIKQRGMTARDTLGSSAHEKVMMSHEQRTEVLVVERTGRGEECFCCDWKDALLPSGSTELVMLPAEAEQEFESEGVRF